MTEFWVVLWTLGVLALAAACLLPEIWRDGP